MLKIAVVGAGIIGKEHLKALRRCDDFELVAICDINEEVASALAAEYGVPYLTDYKKIPQKTHIDAVLLNLPHALHCEAATFFLGAGVHVFLEKPMAMTVAECDEMIAVAEKAQRVLAIGHLQRFFGINRRVKAYAESGELGRLFAINEIRSIGYFAPSRPRWFLSKKLSGGGIVMNYGAHALDKVLYLTNSEIARVYAVCDNLQKGMEIEGHAQFLVQTTSGVSATVTFSSYSNVGYETTYIFEKGAIRVENGGKLMLCKEGVWAEIPLSPDRDYMLLQLQEFAKLVRGEASEMPDAKYGREIVKALEAIYAFETK